MGRNEGRVHVALASRRGGVSMRVSTVIFVLILGCNSGSLDPKCAPNCADTDTTETDTDTDSDADSDADADSDTDTTPVEDCEDGVDNDSDGFVDCEDADCDTDPMCHESTCDDGLDNDNDGLSDCADLDCAADAWCQAETLCADGFDNDNDALLDCADPDCAADVWCQAETLCADGFDNDNDGLGDCLDPDCFAEAPCLGENLCDDGVDNDNDGLLDCEDAECAAFAECLGETLCADGLDNDIDGRIDCDDDDCWGAGCAAALSKMNGLASFWTEYRHVDVFAFGSPGCVGASSYYQAQMAIVSATGTVRYMPASTPIWSTCTWAVGRTYWTPGSGGQPVMRSGFTVQPGCALTTSSFLPQFMTTVNTSPASPFNSYWEVLTRPSGSGTIWADFDGYSWQNYPASSSYLVPGAPCSSSISTTAARRSIPNAYPGDTYIQVR